MSDISAKDLKSGTYKHKDASGEDVTINYVGVKAGIKSKTIDFSQGILEDNDITSIRFGNRGEINDDFHAAMKNLMKENAKADGLVPGTKAHRFDSKFLDILDDGKVSQEFVTFLSEVQAGNIPDATYNLSSVNLDDEEATVEVKIPGRVDGVETTLKFSGAYVFDALEQIDISQNNTTSDGVLQLMLDAYDADVEVNINTSDNVVINDTEYTGGPVFEAFQQLNSAYGDPTYGQDPSNGPLMTNGAHTGKEQVAVAFADEDGKVLLGGKSGSQIEVDGTNMHALFGVGIGKPEYGKLLDYAERSADDGVSLIDGGQEGDTFMMFELVNSMDGNKDYIYLDGDAAVDAIEEYHATDDSTPDTTI